MRLGRRRRRLVAGARVVGCVANVVAISSCSISGDKRIVVRDLFLPDVWFEIDPDGFQRGVEGGLVAFGLGVREEAHVPEFGVDLDKSQQLAMQDTKYIGGK